MKVGARNLLHLVEIFADLDVEMTNAIGDRCLWTRAPAGRTIVEETEQTTDVFFITEGLVDARSYSSTGQLVSYVEIERGGLFGEFSAIDGKERSASIRTRKETLLARLDGSTFRQILIEHPTVALRLCETLVAKNRMMSERLFEYATLNVKKRIVREILRMAEAELGAGETGDGPVEVQSSATHAEIAARLATHREAVSRTLSTLASDGILEPGVKRFTILDMGRLRSLAAED